MRLVEYAKDMEGPEHVATAVSLSDHSQQHICILIHPKDMKGPEHVTIAVSLSDRSQLLQSIHTHPKDMVDLSAQPLHHLIISKKN